MTAEQIRNCNPKILRRMCNYGVRVKWIAELCGVSDRKMYVRLKELGLKINKVKRI